MAKAMRIQTLAEGVETKEQFEFLRGIGCEKIQGYYFGRPMNKEDFKENIEKNGLGVEPRSMRHYYSEIGQINLMSDRPVALLEHENGHFHPVYENEPFHKVMAEVGADSLEESEKRLNDSGSLLHQTYENFTRKVEAEDHALSIVYPERDRMIRLEALTAAQYGSRYMLQLSVRLEEDREVSVRQKKLDSYLRALALIYDGAVAIHLKEDRIERIFANGSYDEFEHSVPGIHRVFRMFAQARIAPEDRERYLAFTDADTLVQRIKASSSGYITGWFHTFDDKQKTFVIKQMMCFLAPNSDGQLAFGMMRQADVEVPGWRERTAEQEYVRSLLWESLAENDSAKYFWKDTEERYLGVSHSFADYYDLNSISRVIGRTDAEIGWSVEGTSHLRDKEQKVLTEGKRICGVHAQTIARGGVREILVTEYPVYDRDKIVGILGYFIDAEETGEAGTDEQKENRAGTDPLTGFLTPERLTANLFRLFESWRLQKQDYEVIMIRIREFDRIHRDYGDSSGEELIRAIGSRIEKNEEPGDIVCRLEAADFVLCFPYRGEQSSAERLKRITGEIESIHQVGDISCTLFADCGTARISEADSFSALSDLAQSRMEEFRRKRREPQN